MSELALHALIRKRAELAGEFERAEAAARELKVALEHLDATILLLQPDTDLTRIKPKKLRPPMAARRGGVAHIIFSTMRAAGRPCPTNELAAHVMAERGMDTMNKKLVTMMEMRVSASLRHYRKRGLVVSTHRPGEHHVWEIVPDSPYAPYVPVE